MARAKKTARKSTGGKIVDEMMSRAEFEQARKEEDAIIITENQTLHDQVEARVQHNIAVFRTLPNYPLDMTNFNDLAVRKLPKEFVKKGRHSYRCSLNALNNALPTKIMLTPTDMMLLRDMKLLQLIEGAIELFRQGVGKVRKAFLSSFILI